MGRARQHKFSVWLPLDWSLPQPAWFSVIPSMMIGTPAREGKSVACYDPLNQGLLRLGNKRRITKSSCRTARDSDRSGPALSSASESTPERSSVREILHHPLTCL